MHREDLLELLRERPFEPIDVSLSDGRSIRIRHPDQAVVTNRKLFVGLAQIKDHRKRLVSPDRVERAAIDWILVDLVHIVSAEPTNGTHPSSGRHLRKRR